MLTEGRKDMFNMAKVVFSNFALLGAGVVTSFLLPKFLSMEGYGLYKIFNLYSTYIIILQFGIIEWLYIKYGGKKLEDVDRSVFSRSFKTLFNTQFVISLVLVLASIFFAKGDSRFIAVALSVNILNLNLTNIYQYLSQAVQRFTELSTRNVSKAILTVVCVIAVFIASKYNSAFADYKIYIGITIGINFVLLLWYIFTYRKLFIRTKAASVKETIAMVKDGFPLCLANIISTLILSIDRQVVSMFFTATDYAIYSFANSLLTLISTVVSSVSLVVFSMFKKQEREKLLANYPINIKRVSILIAGAATVYFPLCWFVRGFLPDYIDSLNILRIVIPGLVFSGPVTVVMHNYYKTLDCNAKFFRISVIMLGVSFVSGVAAKFIFGTMASISWVSVTLMLIWYILVERYLKKQFNISSMINIVYMIVLAVIFYLITLCSAWYIGMVLYFCLFILITFAFYRKELMNILKI